MLTTHSAIDACAAPDDVPWLHRPLRYLREAPGGSLRYALGMLVLAVLYALTAELGTKFASIGVNVSAVWPPTGLMLGLLYLVGLRYVPGLLLGAFVSFVASGISIPAAVGESLANASAAGAAVWFLRRVHLDETLERPRDVVSLLLGAGALCTMPSAFLGTATLWWEGALRGTEVPHAWVTWWVGDLVATLTIAPLVMVYGALRRPHPGAGTRPEAVLVALGTLGLSMAVFDTWRPEVLAPYLQPFVVMPLSFWAALRFGTRGASLAVLTIAAVATFGTSGGVGTFGVLDKHEALLVLQLFLGMNTSATLFLAATSAQQSRSSSNAELLAAAVRGSSEGLVLLDAQCRIVLANEAVGRITGYAEGELVGMTLWSLQAPDAPAVAADVEKACRAGLPISFESTHVRKDGAHIAVEAHVSPIQKPHAVVPFVCSYRDVTARKQMQAALAVQERLASVGTLAAGVAHEINNPLTYVMSNLSMLARKLHQVDPALAVYASDALDGAERIRVIVGDLKVVMRTDREPEEEVLLNDVVTRAVGMAGLDASPSGRVELLLGLPATARVKGSSTRLGQVVTNLLDNASHALGAHGQGRVVVRTRQDGHDALIEVQDTGVGIPSEHLPRIFEPFFTTKPPGVGQGLGLYVCDRIVQQHGGRIQVASTPGEGSTFTLRLPLAPHGVRELEPAPSSARPGVQDGVAGVRRRRVLIVDDEPKLGFSMRMLLQDQHDVTVVTAGYEALERLQAGARFDVILCDLHMPEMSGVQLYRAIASVAPEAAASMIFMSGGAFTDEARTFVASSKHRILEKPIRPETLLQTIESAPGPSV